MIVDKFELFRRKPAELLTAPPLASSLQLFESSLFLISLWRYPHALAACVSAIESSIKASLRVSSTERIEFSELLQRARDQGRLCAVEVQHLTEFVSSSNNFTEFGTSPKDDDACARLLLKTGIPFLAATYKEFFKFDLIDGLMFDVGEQLAISLDVFERSQNALREGDCVGYFCVLAHVIRWLCQFLTDWEIDVLERADERWLKFEVQQDLRSKLESHFRPAWTFRCPICLGFESLVCQLDLNNAHSISIIRGVCIECEVILPSDLPLLTNSVCKEELAVEQEKIMSEFFELAENS